MKTSSPNDARTPAAAGVAAGRGADPEAIVARIREIAARLNANRRDGAAWCELGASYLALSEFAEAQKSYARAIAIGDDLDVAWYGYGLASDALGDLPRALESFGRASEHAPQRDDVRLAYASALLDAGAPDLALDQAEVVVARIASGGARPNAAPLDARAHFVHGSVLAALGRHDDALAAYDRALARDATLAEAHYDRALALDELGRVGDAVAACERALELDASLDPALATLVHAKRRIADWRDLDALSARLRAAVRAGRPGITPFSFLSEPATAAEQLACARTWAQQKIADVAPVVLSQPLHERATPFGNVALAKPRVGFVSNGFNNHPTALLVVELVERLRGGAYTTVGVATAPSDGGALRARLAKAFDEFVELEAGPAFQRADRLRALKLDVLIDLRGYGGGSISELLALRLAKVQVNWLAYPGTSGAPFIDYLIADRHVVPAAAREHYSEALVRMPHAFQPSDSTRLVRDPPARADCGLPPTGVVLASFNNAYKIAPDVFAAWMRILRDVPAAVLWLLDAKDAAFRANLEREARAAGVDPARLVWMKKRPHDEYLARFVHVDLFLDTWPYGAHTTASDALWAGAPVLTLPGETFASRVGLSLVATLGLSDALVASSVDDYVARAVAYARDPATLRAVRDRLAAAKRDTPLFDMRRFAADFTRAIDHMLATAHPRDLDL